MSSTEKGGPKTGTAREKFGSLPITVAGLLVTAADSELVIDDVSEGHSRVAAQMSFWGKVWAAAEEEKIQADAHYRRFRAQKAKDLAGPNLDKWPAEWKLKTLIEADDAFIGYKNALAKAEANVVTAKTQFYSFEEKGRQLQSEGARQRGELNTQRRDTTRRNPERTRAEEGSDEDTDPRDPEPALGADSTKELNDQKLQRAQERMRESNANRGKKSK